MAAKKFSEFNEGQSSLWMDYLVGYGQTGNVRLNLNTFVSNLFIQKTTQKNQPNGYAGLDANGRLYTSAIPSTHGSWNAFTYKSGGNNVNPSYKKAFYTVNSDNVKVHGVFKVTTSQMTISKLFNTAAITTLPFAPAAIPGNRSFSGYDGFWGETISTVEGGPLGTWAHLNSSMQFVRSGVIIGVTRYFGGSEVIEVSLSGIENGADIQIPVNDFIKFNFEYIKA